MTDHGAAHDDHHHTAAAAPTGRKPITVGYIVLMALLLGAIAFYFFFAIPEFFGIVGGTPIGAEPSLGDAVTNAPDGLKGH